MRVRSVVIPAPVLRSGAIGSKRWCRHPLGATPMTMPGICWAQATPNMQFAAQDAHYRRHYPNTQYSIIEVQGVSAGRLYVDRCEKEIRIIDIALLPEHRRAGIGTKLLRELQDEARIGGAHHSRREIQPSP